MLNAGQVSGVIQRETGFFSHARAPRLASFHYTIESPKKLIGSVQLHNFCFDSRFPIESDRRSALVGAISHESKIRGAIFTISLVDLFGNFLEFRFHRPAVAVSAGQCSIATRSRLGR